MLQEFSIKNSYHSQGRHSTTEPTQKIKRIYTFVSKLYFLFFLGSYLHKIYNNKNDYIHNKDFNPVGIYAFTLFMQQTSGYKYYILAYSLTLNNFIILQYYLQIKGLNIKFFVEFILLRKSASVVLHIYTLFP